MIDHRVQLDELYQKWNPVIDVDRAQFCWQGKVPPVWMIDSRLEEGKH